MKKVFVFFSFLLLSFTSVIAQDVLYTISNDVSELGIRQITNVDPLDGSGATLSESYATADPTTRSAAMALANNGYLYYISQDDETQGGVFTLRSIATNTAAVSNIALDNLDINGSDNDNDVTFRSLAAAPDGSIYILASEYVTASPEDYGITYLAKVTPTAGGLATNFQSLGIIALDGVSEHNPLFRNGDIAFDGNGNLYALINEDFPIAAGNAVIYFAPASAISTTSGGVTNFQTKYAVKNSVGDNFADYVTGLALASSGNFYLMVQGETEGGIYLLRRDLNGDFVISDNPISDDNASTVADVATGYFPTTTILPVVYGTITAKVANGSLIVNWTTLSEIGNAHFEIEVSKNGVDFFPIGTVKTKALNGNSDHVIEYEFSKTVNVPLAAMGISILSVAFILLLLNRKNKLLLSLIMFIGLGISISSCSKNRDQIDLKGEEKLYVRVVQVDIDGTKTYSEIIKAFKAD